MKHYEKDLLQMKCGKEFESSDNSMKYWFIRIDKIEWTNWYHFVPGCINYEKFGWLYTNFPKMM